MGATVMIPKDESELSISERLGDILLVPHDYFIFQGNYDRGGYCVECTITKVTATAKFGDVSFFSHGKYYFTLKIGEYEVNAWELNYCWSIESPKPLYETARGAKITLVGFSGPTVFM